MKLILKLNLVALIPWVVFNLTTGAWGLFPVNVITIISSVRGLRLLGTVPPACKSIKNLQLEILKELKKLQLM
ncbi:hypothetical protein QUF79_00620 [Fictibacillus enclensis]|nr:hypothetical protein [Fictibacillus enclensis]